MDVIVHPSYDEIEDFVENQSLDDFLGTTTIDVPAKEIIDPVKTGIRPMKQSSLTPERAIELAQLARLEEETGNFDLSFPSKTRSLTPDEAIELTQLARLQEETGDFDLSVFGKKKAVEDGLLAKAGNYLRNGAQGDFKFRDLMNKNVATLGGSAAGLALLNAIEGDSLLGNVVQTGTGVGLGALAGGLIRNTRYGSSPFGGLIVGGAALAGNTLMGAIGSMLGMDEKDEQELYRQSLSYANGAAQQQQQAYAAQQPYE